eukprot:526708_1
MQKVIEVPSNAEWSVRDGMDLDGNSGLIGTKGPDDNGADSGAVYYVRRKNSNDWNTIQKILQQGGIAGNQFGAAIAMDGLCNMFDVPLNIYGRAYMFERNTSDYWVYLQELNCSMTGKNDICGRSVAIEGNKAIVSESTNICHEQQIIDGNYGLNCYLLILYRSMHAICYLMKKKMKLCI